MHGRHLVYRLSQVLAHGLLSLFFLSLVGMDRTAPASQGCVSVPFLLTYLFGSPLYLLPSAHVEHLEEQEGVNTL